MHRKLLLSTLLIAVAAFAQDAKPDFSGTWKLNAAKSDFGQMPPPNSRTDKIEHKEPQVKESVSMVSDQGEMQWDLTYTTDGKESKGPGIGGQGEMASTAHWEGKTLVVDTKAKFQDSDVTIHGTTVLSDDGKVLTRTAHVAGPWGEGDQKMVFDKQ